MGLKREILTLPKKPKEKFDPKRPHGVSYGPAGYQYVQDGKLYNTQGMRIPDDTQ